VLYMQGVQQIETLGTQAKQQQYPRRQPCRHSLHFAARRHDNGGRALPPPVPGIHGGHLLRQLRWRWHPAGNAASAGQLLLTELRLQPGRRARPRGGRAPQRRPGLQRRHCHGSEACCGAQRITAWEIEIEMEYDAHGLLLGSCCYSDGIYF
jgi:hypothetical protein